MGAPPMPQERRGPCAQCMLVLPSKVQSLYHLLSLLPKAVPVVKQEGRIR